MNRRNRRVINGFFFMKIGEEEKYQIEINLFKFVFRLRFFFSLGRQLIELGTYI